MIRVNARLDEQGESDLKYLQQVTRTTSTDIIKAALRFYAVYIRQEAGQQKTAMLKCGFIGSFQAADDLSANYKQQAREVLDAKYPPQ